MPPSKGEIYNLKVPQKEFSYRFLTEQPIQNHKSLHSHTRINKKMLDMTISWLNINDKGNSQDRACI